MKRLFLLRHAHTVPLGYNTTDKARALTEKGKADAAELGRVMQTKSYQPDYVLCSPAKRTKQTFEGLCQSIHIGKQDFPERLYGASRGDLLHFIQTTPAEVGSLLLIAHNPGIFELVVTLADDRSADMVGFGYPPGTLSVFDCDINKWSDIQPAANTLTDFITH